MFLVVHGRFVAVSLLRPDVHHGGARRVFYLTEQLHQSLHVVALFKIVVIETESAKEIQFRLSSGVTQQFEILIDAAVVFGNTHLVIVHDDDDVRTDFSCRIQAFESLAAAQTPVADKGNDILLSTQDVASFLQTRGQGNGSRGVSHLEIVVNGRFQRRTIARNGIHSLVVEKSLGASCEHLVWVTLVRNIENELIFGRIEHIVQGHNGLCRTEIRPHMSAMMTHAMQHCGPYFFSHSL